MINTLYSLPLWAQAIGFGLLGWGTVVIFLFIGRYVTTLPWAISSEGRHLVSMSANIGAFFVVYLVQAVWPEIPGRKYIMIGLLLALVINCTWRWRLLERHIREQRESSGTE